MNRTEPLKILVVDDEFIVRQTLKAYFDHLGHQVLEAGSGEFALKALENHSFDAVVADMGMPGMDGVAFLKKCRDTFPDMPVFLASGKAVEVLEQEAAGAGATGFLKKPFRINDIRNLVEAIVRAKGAGD